MKPQFAAKLINVKSYDPMSPQDIFYLLLADPDRGIT